MLGSILEKISVGTNKLLLPKFFLQLTFMFFSGCVTFLF